MFGIIAYDYEDKKVEKSTMDGSYAMFMFRQFTKCEDAKQVIIIDGLTGEVILDWRKGEIVYVKGVGDLY